ncbi:glycosyltransferase family protein [Autumnicola musiva]|uniref:Glycosyltransferase n=1 Tax=Autumnicola musiva TaxID=3075589 RepID=A0ABU3D345_9FLAO|nr:glycosyltransferase [Zunongwangia sp. F117]MDT0675956.1 glycosyltransferase [Zunongwangia sp. F117]
MKKLKLLKFDIIHPAEYLSEKKKEWGDVDKISLAEYRNRLISLRSNYSDFYTYHLNQQGDWEAEEFFLLDDDFIEKAGKEVLGKSYYYKRFLYGRGRTKLNFQKRKWRNYVVHNYIKHFKPDVIFARSQPIPSAFWRRYRKDTLLVARLSARLPYSWHPNDWDLIYTDQPDFKTFFELHGVETILNDQGFDCRINEELRAGGSNEDVVFVGGLGTENFLKRTLFFNEVAQHIQSFRWWGYWWKYGGDGRRIQDFPMLEKCFQGATSGLEMLQIYKDSFAVVNDYVDTANSIGFNQRIFEVMGVGGFLVTRDAPNFREHFPEDVFVTYKDLVDLQQKLDYYKSNPGERLKITNNAKAYIKENYDYERICHYFSKDLKKSLRAKN